MSLVGIILTALLIGVLVVALTIATVFGIHGRWVKVLWGIVGLAGLFTLYFLFQEPISGWFEGGTGWLSNTFSYFTDAYTADGEMKTWLMALTIAGVLLVAFMVLYRKSVYPLLRGFIIAAIIVGLATFVLDKFGSAPDTKVERGCVVEPFFGTYDKVTEKKRPVTLDGNRTSYQVWVPKGREADFRIEFTENPAPEYPSLELDVEDFVKVVYKGDGKSSLDERAGLGPGRLYLHMDREAYRTQVNGSCLNYYVYLSPQS